MHPTKLRFPLIASSTALLVILLDQLSKAFMLAHPAFLKTGDWFELFLTTNTGIAFSIPLKGTLLYVAIIIVIGIALYYAKSHARLEHPLTGIVVGLIVGGGIGNLIDRLHFGHVIDFIKIGSWPLFNVADSAITCAILILLLWHKKIISS